MAYKERSAFDVLSPELALAFSEWSQLSRRLSLARNPSEIRALNAQKTQWEQMHGPHARGEFEIAEAYLTSQSDDNAGNRAETISKSPLDELSAIGLSLVGDEGTARGLWADLLCIDASVRRNRPGKPAEPVQAVYQAIAKHIVTAETPDPFLEATIPQAIFLFCSARPAWSQYGSLEILRGVLEPCVLEWKAARLKMTPTGRPDALYADRVHFQYAYPADFPADAQRQVESLRVRANASLQARTVNSFADWSEAKRVWVLEMASGAARIIGGFAAMNNWSANQARKTLKDFTLQAAFAAGMTAPAAEGFFQSDEWKRLDDELFPPPETSERPALTPPGSTEGLEEESDSDQIKPDSDKSLLYERVSPDDPNHSLLKRAFLEAWADSHGLVADGWAGKVSLSDYVDGCVNTFDQGAQIHVSLKDTTPISERCDEIDRMADASVDIFSRSLASESERLGEADVEAAVEDYSRRIREIASRSKQSIHLDALAAIPDPKTGHPATESAGSREPPEINSKSREYPRLASFYKSIAAMDESAGSIEYETAQIHGSVDPDPFADEDAEPFGVNPFPDEHPAHSAFTEGTWQSKADLNKLRLDLITAAGDPEKDPIQAMLTFRVRAFASMSKAALLTVGNRETAVAYERWLQDFARFILEDTIRKGQLKPPGASSDRHPLFRPEILPDIRNDLTRELMKVVAFHKHQLSERVLLGLQQRAAATSALANPDETQPDRNWVQEAVSENQTPTQKGVEEQKGPAADSDAEMKSGSQDSMERRGPRDIVLAARVKKTIRSFEKFASYVGIARDSLIAITEEKRWVSDELYALVARACGCKPEELHPRGLPMPARRRR